MNTRVMLGSVAGLGLLVACMPSMAQTTAAQTTSAQNTVAQTTAPAAAPAAATPAAKPTEIAMKLTEWTMGMDMTPMKVKGAVLFSVENVGKFPHTLAIEGKIGGQDFELSSPVLKPGEKTSLMIHLPAGTYTVYCPVGKHEAQGMKAELVIE